MSIEFKDIAAPSVQYAQQQTEGVPRDGRGKPLVILPSGGKPVALTRTTTFIDCIEDKSTLSDWGKRSTLLGVSRRPDLIDALKALDPYGNRKVTKEDPAFRSAVDDLVEKALVAAGAHDKREKGTELHGYSEFVDRGEPLPEGITDADRADLAEYAMATIGLSFQHVEEFVVCPELLVGGTPDRVCKFDPWRWKELKTPPGARPNDSYIFDLKTGTTEYGGLKMAAQLAIYSRAEFYDHTTIPAPPRYDSDGKETKEWKAWKSTEHDADLAASAYTPMPKVNRKWGIILNLPAGSGESELLWADLTYGWKMAKLAQTIRAGRSGGSKALASFALSG